VGFKIDTLTLHKTQTRHKSQEHASTSLKKKPTTMFGSFQKLFHFSKRNIPIFFKQLANINNQYKVELSKEKQYFNALIEI
jgi:hypothetical protein